MKLLKKMCKIHAPSGEEFRMTKFLTKYIQENKKNWQVKPVIHYGDEFQDNIILLDNINLKLNPQKINDSQEMLEVKLRMTFYGKI